MEYIYSFETFFKISVRYGTTNSVISPCLVACGCYLNTHGQHSTNNNIGFQLCQPLQQQQSFCMDLTRD